MAAFNVTVVQENKYIITDSNQIKYKGRTEGTSFIRDDAKNAKIIGVLKEGFKRSIFRNSNGEDYVYPTGGPDTLLLPVLDAIEQREHYILKNDDYIILTNWE